MTFRFTFFQIVLLFAQAEPLFGQEIINPNLLREIKFEEIPPTKTEFKDSILYLKVDRSSSALIHSFDQIRKVSHLTVEWKTSLIATASNQSIEKTKAGDDFPLRVGILVSGKRPWIPMFAPRWVRALTFWLRHPTNRMIYAVMGSTQPAGEKWISPFSDSIENVALSAVAQADGFFLSKLDFPETEIVGYWIMADGDDRKIVFETAVKSLKIW